MGDLDPNHWLAKANKEALERIHMPEELRACKAMLAYLIKGMGGAVVFTREELVLMDETATIQIMYDEIGRAHIKVVES